MMDARVCARPGCGNPLLPGSKLKSFCSYACRGQFSALEATTPRTGLICSKNIKQNKALQTLKRQSVTGFSFAKINSCTYRLDRPSKFGAGWLMEVGPGGKWVARVGDRASEPMTLDHAKQAAVATPVTTKTQTAYQLKPTVTPIPPRFGTIGKIINGAGFFPFTMKMKYKRGGSRAN